MDYLHDLHIRYSFLGEDHPSKDVVISFSDRGMDFEKTMGPDLTTADAYFLSAVAFLYAGLVLKGIVPDPDFVVQRAYALCGDFLENYEGAKRLEDMTLEEFSSTMNQWVNSRDD